MRRGEDADREAGGWQTGREGAQDHQRVPVHVHAYGVGLLGQFRGELRYPLHGLRLARQRLSLECGPQVGRIHRTGAASPGPGVERKRTGSGGEDRDGRQVLDRCGGPRYLVQVPLDPVELGVGHRSR